MLGDAVDQVDTPALLIDLDGEPAGIRSSSHGVEISSASARTQLLLTAWEWASWLRCPDRHDWPQWTTSMLFQGYQSIVVARSDPTLAMSRQRRLRGGGTNAPHRAPTVHGFHPSSAPLQLLRCLIRNCANRTVFCTIIALCAAFERNCAKLRGTVSTLFPNVNVRPHCKVGWVCCCCQFLPSVSTYLREPKSGSQGIARMPAQPTSRSQETSTLQWRPVVMLQVCSPFQ